MDFQDLKHEIRFVKNYRERLIERVVKIRCSLENVTLKTDKERVQGGYYIDLADKIHSIVELEKKIAFCDDELCNYEMIAGDLKRKLNNKNDIVKYDFYLGEQKPKEIAEKFDLSERQIYRIIKQ